VILSHKSPRLGARRPALMQATPHVLMTRCSRAVLILLITRAHCPDTDRALAHPYSLFLTKVLRIVLDFSSGRPLITICTGVVLCQSLRCTGKGVFPFLRAWNLLHMGGMKCYTAIYTTRPENRTQRIID